MSINFSDLNLRGTIRTRAAEETLKVIEPYIQKAHITRIANLTHLDCIKLPVYTCIRPLSRNLSTSQGKGITDALAKCSAYMEAIETFYAEQIVADLVCAYDDIPEAHRINLTQLRSGMLSAEPLHSAIHEWTATTRMRDQQKIYLPTHYFCFDLSRPNLENGLFRKTTTGLASGNSFKEALCHALYEIIERNALFEFHQLPVVQKRARAVRLESIQFPEARALIDILHSHRIDIALYEITNRFNFPSYTCTIADENPFRKLGHYTGAGTHSFKGIAVCRALTEAVQSRLTYIAGSRDDMFPQDYTLSWSKLSVPGVLDFDSMPSRPYGHIDEQLEDILSMLSSYGLDVLYHRHTQADEPITVLKCVVPGIQI